jgi:medium-chain acyl-[acyl-carrier-protein] hydrolase
MLSKFTDEQQNMTGAPASSNWFLCRKAGGRASLRLFCFPYAGGSASIFRGWPESLPASVEVCAVQLPGRGSRLLEPAVTEMPQLVRALALAIVPYLDKPFAFFGHSMGSTISLELARHLRAEHRIEPAHLFVSGSRAPHVRNTEPHSYDLPDAEFLEELRRLNGTPAEILEHPELMQLMMPVLRADFKLFQTYAYTEAAPLSCPITAYGGLQDREVDRKRLQVWRAQTTAHFSLNMIPGDHFFIHASQPALLSSLSEELNGIVSRISPV